MAGSSVGQTLPGMYLGASPVVGIYRGSDQVWANSNAKMGPATFLMDPKPIQAFRSAGMFPEVAEFDFAAVDAGLSETFRLGADPASFAQTPVDSALRRDYILRADLASFVMTPEFMSTYPIEDIPGLLRWYDFSDLSTRTMSGSNVATLADKSGNDRTLVRYTQFIGNDGPTLSTINGRTAGLYALNLAMTNGTPGGSDGLDAISGSDIPLTAFIVAEPTTINHTGYLFGMARAGQSDALSFLLVGSKWRFQKRNSAGSQQVNVESTTNLTAAPHVITVVHHGATTTVRVDGDIANYEAAQDVDSTTVIGFGLGTQANQSTSISESFQGKIGEMLLVAGDMSEDDYVAVEQYLGGKWGISVQVPSPPAQMSVDDWHVRKTSSTQILITVVQAPDPRGSPITGYEYRIDGGTWTTLVSAPGSLTVGSLTTDVTVDVEVRAVNAKGGGDPSAVKVATPTTFLPTSLTGINRWYDPSDSATLTVASNAVSAMTDKSGGGFTISQASSSLRPGTLERINAVPCLKFDGSNDRMQSDSGMAALSGTDVAYTVLCVVQATTMHNGWVWVFNNSSGNSYTGFAFNGLTPAWFSRRRDTGSVTADASSSADVDTEPHLLTVVHTGTAITIRLDGANTSVVGASQNVGAVTVSRFMLGNYLQGSTAGTYFTGRIGEVIVCTGALDGSSVAAAERYLAERWGIQL